MKFRMDQEVVCITNGDWETIVFDKVLSLIGIKRAIRKAMKGPKYNDIVTIDGYDDNEFLYLKEYNFIDFDGKRPSYHESGFAPLADISDIEALLKEEPKFDV